MIKTFILKYINREKNRKYFRERGRFFPLRLHITGLVTIILLVTTFGLSNEFWLKFDYSVMIKPILKKFSVWAQGIPILLFPSYPQRLVLITEEMVRLSEELVSYNDQLKELTNKCNCKFAESHCVLTSEPLPGGGQSAKCKPGPLNVFGEACPSPLEFERSSGELEFERSSGEGVTIEGINSQIVTLVGRLSQLQGILEQEMELGLERELATLWPEDAQILEENLEKLRQNIPEIIALAQKTRTLPDECSLENCQPRCRFGPSGELEACARVAGQQKPTEVKFKISASVTDFEPGTVQINNINLNLPKEIQLPDLTNLIDFPTLNISIPDITLSCPTEQQTFIFPTPSPNLPPAPTLKLSCPDYVGLPTTNQCQAPAGGSAQNYPEVEWHFKTLSYLSEKCLKVIERRNREELDSEDELKEYEDLIKKCLTPDTVIPTLIDQCKKKWIPPSFFDPQGKWELPRETQYEICAQIGRQEERRDRARYWCQNVIAEITENFTVCIDDRPGLIYERNGSKARVYISGSGPNVDRDDKQWGHNCGGDPGFWNTNEGKVLALEWDWNDKPDGTTVTVYGERGNERIGDKVWPPTKDTPERDTNTVTYSKPAEMSGQEVIKTIGGSVYRASGAQKPNDRRVVAIWNIPGGVQAPNQADCNDNPINTLKQKCQEMREAKIERPTLACNLLPVLSGKLEGISSSTIVGPGGSCNPSTVGDYPSTPISGCTIAFPSIPKITFPKIIVPDIRLPSFNLPPIFYVKLPNLIFEDLVLPDIELCNLDDCRFRFPDLSFQLPSLKIPEIKIPPVTIERPGLPRIEIGIEPIQFRPLEFNFPQMINLASLVTPELELPEISLPQPQITIEFTGLNIDLLNLLLGLHKEPIGFGGCVSLKEKLWGLKIDYPDFYFSWPDFPRIPEISSCKDIRDYCQKANESIGEITKKVDEIQNIVNKEFQSEIQDKLDEIAKTIQQEISKEIDKQLKKIADKIDEALRKHLSKHVPQNIVAPLGPIPGVWEVVGEIPCQNVPPLKIDLEDIKIDMGEIEVKEGSATTTLKKYIENYISNKFPTKTIPIRWKELEQKLEQELGIEIELEKFILKNKLVYDLPKPDPPLSKKLSYSREFIRRLPGLQVGWGVDFRFKENPPACLNLEPEGGNPCPIDEIKENRDKIEELKNKINEASQKIKDVLL